MDHTDNLNTFERWTRILLLVMGCSICFSLVPLFFPTEWLQHIHDLLGIGKAPQQPIFEYMARSLCAMYFAHGIFVLAVASDVQRYWPFVRVIAVLNMLLSFILFVTDISAELPKLWIAFEGPPILAGALILLWLWYRGTKARASVHL